jgi:hypothetical protein
VGQRDALPHTGAAAARNAEEARGGSSQAATTAARRTSELVMEAAKTRRESLTEYVKNSRSVQRSMRWIGLVGLGLALCLLLGGAGRSIAVGVAALVAIVVGAGLWITQGHIADFEQQLRKLDRK